MISLRFLIVYSGYELVAPRTPSLLLRIIPIIFAFQIAKSLCLLAAVISDREILN